jgi:predicted HTH domain antitoxin
MSHTLSLEYPENLPDALHMSRAEFEQEARLAMAAKLFETGKLTSGQAARLVGMARVAFLSELGRLGVSAIQVSRKSWRRTLPLPRLPPVIILNRSPVLQLTAGLGSLDVLPTLYSPVLVPAEVLRELESGATLDDAAV